MLELSLSSLNSGLQDPTKHGYLPVWLHLLLEFARFSPSSSLANPGTQHHVPHYSPMFVLVLPSAHTPM
jgi:hypothetical protein